MVYILLADGFEEIEAVYPIDVLRRCGVDVKTVGIPSELVVGSNKITIKTDITIDHVDYNQIKMLILPGGPGRVNLKENEQSLSLIRHCCESGVPVAAICGAPEILGDLGYLNRRKATCYPGLEGKLSGAEYVSESVVIDGNLITSQAAGTSEAFAYAIAEYLCGKEKAEEVFGRMYSKLAI